MSQICTQCNGKAGTRGQEAIIDVSANTESFQGASPAPIPCNQCNGLGYQ